MKKIKRHIDTFTRLNVLFGSRLAKSLVLLATMILALVTNIYPVYNTYSLLYIGLVIFINGILLVNYYRNINLLQYGVFTTGNFHNREETRYYSQGNLGNHYLCRYLFTFKDLERKQYELIKWTTKDGGFGGEKKSDILYSIKNPDNAMVICLLQGGPYSVTDDQVYSPRKIISIFDALLTITGIVVIFFYLF